MGRVRRRIGIAFRNRRRIGIGFRNRRWVRRFLKKRDSYSFRYQRKSCQPDTTEKQSDQYVEDSIHVADVAFLRFCFV